MTLMKLYKILQTVTGELNHIVISLYKEEITVDAARESATKLLTDALKNISE
ncbi:MAG: hypothetical protein LLG40_11140 [Deltaproteobacteria bacterium]|nr:hypothetical protein [Deltaproteobacteria bacterium]